MSNYRTRVMLAGLTISKYDGRKLDKKVSREVNTAKNAVQGAARVNKDLFTKDALSAYKAAASEAYEVHYKLTLPWGDDGYRVLPVDMYFEYLQAMAAVKVKFENAVKEFIMDYDAHVEEARKTLGDMWNQYEYLKREEVAQKFYFDIKLMPMPDAADFRVDIADAEVAVIQADIQRRLNESVVDALKDPLRKLYKLMSHMVEKLNDPESQFQYTMVENIRELVGMIPKLNFTNDPTLTQIANDAKLLTLHSADTLRNDFAVRNAVASHAQTLINKVEGWI
jgi:hypothetical protein